LLEYKIRVIKKSKRSKNSKLPYLVGLVALLVVVGGVYSYHLSSKKKPALTVDQYTKGQVNQPTSSSNSTSSKQSSNSSTSSTSGSKTTVTTASLAAPSGNFVSDHHPNLSGTPAPNSMTSVCNTTPGASCQISFTSDGTTKSLATEVTDGGGTTYWYWKLQDIGLTAGSWTITAKSSMSGSTKTSTDPMALVVSQ